MGAILKRELSSYFNSATAYVVMAVYFFFSGLFFYLYCFGYNSASLAGVYGNMFYIIMFIIPIITASKDRSGAFDCSDKPYRNRFGQVFGSIHSLCYLQLHLPCLCGYHFFLYHTRMVGNSLHIFRRYTFGSRTHCH